MIPPRYGPRLNPADLPSLLADFERFLRAHVGDVPIGSALESYFLAAYEVAAIAREEIEHDRCRDMRKAGRVISGLVDLSRKLLAARHLPGFDQVLPHVRLLSEQSTLLQNLTSPVTDQASNLLFELYVALAALRLGTGLQVEPPGGSVVPNPDVLVTIDGVRWGVACKVAHSASPLTYADRFRDGVRQLQRARVERGVVLTSLKNVFPHDEFWQVDHDEKTGECRDRSHASLAHAFAYIYSYMNEAIEPVDIHRALGDTTALAAKLMAQGIVPAYVHFIATTGVLHVDGTKALVSFAWLFRYELADVDPVAADVIQRLNYALQSDENANAASA